MTDLRVATDFFKAHLPKDVLDAVNLKSLSIERYFLKPFHLIDLTAISDEELRKHTWAGIMEFFMKHIFATDILPLLKQRVDIMQIVAEKGGKNYILSVIRYIIERVK